MNESGSLSLQIEDPSQIFACRNAQPAVRRKSRRLFVAETDAEDLLAVDFDRRFHRRCKSRVVYSDCKFVSFEEGILEFDRGRLGSCDLEGSLGLRQDCVTIEYSDIFASIR